MGKQVYFLGLEMRRRIISRLHFRSIERQKRNLGNLYGSMMEYGRLPVFEKSLHWLKTRSHVVGGRVVDLS